jgi:CRP/FNR family cyclic AMP-dependent transcriptional regulator
VRRPVTHSLVQALRVVPAFTTLSDNALLKIVGASANLSWPAGGTVFEKGTPGDALYIVLSGSVAILDLIDGEEVEITRVPDGEFFGEVSLLMDTSHSMTARAMEDTELMVLPKESLQELLESNAELDEYFRRKVEERVPGSLSQLS